MPAGDDARRPGRAMRPGRPGSCRRGRDVDGQRDADALRRPLAVAGAARGASTRRVRSPISPECSARPMNVSGESTPRVGVVPADQRLDAAGAEPGQLDLRLVVDEQLVAVERPAQLVDQAGQHDLLAVELGVEQRRGRRRAAWPGTWRRRRARSASGRGPRPRGTPRRRATRPGARCARRWSAARAPARAAGRPRGGRASDRGREGRRRTRRRRSGRPCPRPAAPGGRARPGPAARRRRRRARGCR